MLTFILVFIYIIYKSCEHNRRAVHVRVEKGPIAADNNMIGRDPIENIEKQ